MPGPMLEQAERRRQREEARMQHAVEVHGLRQMPCPLRCLPESAREDCPACQGDAVVFTIQIPKPCGPDCLLGNPQ